ncbi:TetR/AcrR family transcriptional regulator [Streptomyces sp. NPDC015125]|uniref:TetR/AcrR family transcriptional regulator n=1 Tax=Streptomyces sp. NPDC015125 TaxID=3364938 RepID=UPI0037016D3A
MESDLIWMRPSKSGTGRPAGRTRVEITEAAVRVADRDGLDGVSMRNVAAELGTGAGSLYRYVDNHGDLLDLMADHVCNEYDLGKPSGDWLADLVGLGLQAREIYRRHPWLTELALTRPVVGPNGIDVGEHFFAALADHPATDAEKLVALGILNAVVAATARSEDSPVDTLRSARYVAHVAAQGNHPHLAALHPTPADGAPLSETLRRILTSLLT